MADKDVDSTPPEQFDGPAAEADEDEQASMDAGLPQADDAAVSGNDGPPHEADDIEDGGLERIASRTAPGADDEPGDEAGQEPEAEAEAETEAEAGVEVEAREQDLQAEEDSDSGSPNLDAVPDEESTVADASAGDGPAERDEEDADSDTETLEAPEGMGQAEITTERVVEAVLFAADAPLPLSKIVSIVGVGSARDIRNHIKALNDKYEKTGAAFRIEQIAGGYQLLSLSVYNTWIRRLKQTKQDSRLSQAAMETLAVVAYKQPVIRADIEAIRGVSAGEMLNRLREVGLIKIVGRAEDVGRPMLYGTTKRFLEVFGLSGLEDLPAVEEMQPGQPPA